jgi:hypothetical protein
MQTILTNTRYRVISRMRPSNDTRGVITGMRVTYSLRRCTILTNRTKREISTELLFINTPRVVSRVF